MTKSKSTKSVRRVAGAHRRLHRTRDTKQVLVAMSPAEYASLGTQETRPKAFRSEQPFVAIPIDVNTLQAWSDDDVRNWEGYFLAIEDEVKPALATYLGTTVDQLDSGLFTPDAEHPGIEDAPGVGAAAGPDLNALLAALTGDDDGPGMFDDGDC